MTPTISAERYGSLLLQYQPKVIKTEAENESFLAITEDLMSRSQLVPEEEILLELLIRLIEDFEEQHYSLNSSTSRSRFLHLMEARELDVGDLAEVLGDRAEAMMSGNEAIEVEDAIALGRFFHVKPMLFLEK